MENNKIILNKSKSKMSTNKDVLLNVELSTNESKLPTDNIVSNIDQYEQYINENDASNVYRLNFTINPICSNVLYNHITEIVQNEGGNNCTYYGNDKSQEVTGSSGYTAYCDGTVYKRDDLIRNTGFSHKDCGNLVYHCGCDIFNNHLLRKNGNVFVNRQNTPNDVFNTIKDTFREWDGNIVNVANQDSTGTTSAHLYNTTNIYSFNETISDKIIEKNGWFGFINTANLETENFVTGSTGIALNKVMNNNKACEFIDLYPDRTLFSFVPKYNKLRNREEGNWHYFLTYPYAQTGCSLVGNESVNGMYADFTDNRGMKIVTAITESSAITPSQNDSSIIDLSDERAKLYLRTYVKNTLKVGDKIEMTIMCDGIRVDTNRITVVSTGINNAGTMYYFTIRQSDISSPLRTIYSKSGDTSDLRCYVRKIVQDRPCKYYMRIFRKIPNFFGTEVYNKDSLTEEQIRQGMNRNFNSRINKVAFSRNIYDDPIAQIVYNDNIDLTGLKDNLGRDLSQIYLTVVKNNDGHLGWYNETTRRFRSNDITYSHCFGTISTGFDLPFYVDDYNIHGIHNVAVGDDSIWPKTFTPLQSGITYNPADGCFYGDIVEFSETNLDETTLEYVQHRFNTAQRESVIDEYKEFVSDEIVSDDYTGNFIVSAYTHGSSDKRVNIAPEGYFYQAHYPIKIREFNSEIKNGYHTIIDFESYEYSGNTLSGMVARNYYLQSGDTIYFKNLKTGKRIEGYVSKPQEAPNFNEVEINIVLESGTTVSDYTVMARNNEKPFYAYDLNDFDGKYIWRDFESCANLNDSSELYDLPFVNGAHYIHKHINFFLKRQDPDGLYGLNYAYYGPEELRNLEFAGKNKDVSQADAITNIDLTIC